MKLQPLDIAGGFEGSDEEVSERLQLALSEDDAEFEAVALGILPHPEIVTEDSARRGYTFRYELGRPLTNGLFVLRITAHDASQHKHIVEIAAGLAMKTVATDPDITRAAAMWFISRRLHYFVVQGSPLEYSGVAYGRLDFPDPDRLPHRRLFGAPVGV